MLFSSRRPAVWRLVASAFERAGVTDLKLPHPKLNAVFREIFAFERKLLGKVPIPFGLSFIAIARKR